MKYCYEEHRFHPKTLALIEKANAIIDEYEVQGYDLTLRQLYYQLVARAIIPNNQRSYKRVGSTMSNARRAGLVDWSSIVDRTREIKDRSHWDNPKQVIAAAIYTYFRDRWIGQDFRPEVWIEKDAVIGVISGVCRELDVPAFACRGYVSDSEMWSAGERMRRHRHKGQAPVVLHLGDHDPSGIDMTRDIRDRLDLFSEQPVEVVRLTLNMGQIIEYNPPPNPAKVTDSRYEGYQIMYGTESWELDALEPSVLVDLIRTKLESMIDKPAWADVENLEAEHIAALHKAADTLSF
jgi:hypothetical protein